MKAYKHFSETTRVDLCT